MPDQGNSRVLPFAAELLLMGDGIHRLVAPEPKGRRLRELFQQNVSQISQRGFIGDFEELPPVPAVLFADAIDGGQPAVFDGPLLGRLVVGHPGDFANASNCSVSASSLLTVPRPRVLLGLSLLMSPPIPAVLVPRG